MLHSRKGGKGRFAYGNIGVAVRLLEEGLQGLEKRGVGGGRAAEESEHELAMGNALGSPELGEERGGIGRLLDGGGEDVFRRSFRAEEEVGETALLEWVPEDYREEDESGAGKQEAVPGVATGGSGAVHLSVLCGATGGLILVWRIRWRGREHGFFGERLGRSGEPLGRGWGSGPPGAPRS